MRLYIEVVLCPADCPNRAINTDGYTKLPDGTNSDSYCRVKMIPCSGRGDYPQGCPLVKITTEVSE